MRKFVSSRSRKTGLAPGTLVHVGDKVHETTQITLFQYDEAQFTERAITDLNELRALKESPMPTWINIDSVHDASLLQQFGEAFGLHPLVLEDILHTDQRPKLEDYGEYLYIVVKMLSFTGETTSVEQVSLILGQEYVLSFQEEGKPGDVFDPIRKRLRNGGGRLRKQGADFLAYSLIDAIVDNYFVVLEQLGERIELLEEQLLNNPRPDTTQTIHHLRRELIFLRRSVWPLRELISAWQRSESALISETTRIYLRDLYDHTIQVIDTVENLRDMLTGMLEIYLSSVSFKMNEVMKVLTIIATLFIPLTFIVGVYGMNFDFLPELHWRWAYPVLWVIMIGITVVMLLYFKRKRWM
jgi:magnesium transporter